MFSVAGLKRYYMQLGISDLRLGKPHQTRISSLGSLKDVLKPKCMMICQNDTIHRNLNITLKLFTIRTELT